MKWKNKTRGGHDYRIYATDGGGNMVIHGAILCKGSWRLTSWLKCGRLVKAPVENQYDLIPDVPEPIEYEANLSPPPEWLKDAEYCLEAWLSIGTNAPVKSIGTNAPVKLFNTRDLSQFIGHKVRVRIEAVE